MNDITVIIPVYNSENALKICVDSVLSQTYKNWKMILVDDGSTDSSPEICDEYANEYDNISVIHKENGGVSSARNAGIDATDSEYIVFIDSDDFVDPSHLQVLIDARKSKPNINNIWCTFKTVGTYNSDCSIQSSSCDYYSTNELIDLFNLWYIQVPVCKLFETRIIKQNNLYMDESIDLGEDFLFNLDYLDNNECKDIVVVNNKSYYYYIGNGDSLDHKYRKDYLDIKLKLMDAVSEHLIKWNLNDEQHQKYYNLLMTTYNSVFENTFKAGNKDSFSKKIWYNNCILRSKRFKDALKKSNCYINPLVKFGYKTHNYLIVLLVYRLAKVIKH